MVGILDVPYVRFWVKEQRKWFSCSIRTSEAARCSTGKVTNGYNVSEWLSQRVETGLTGRPHVLCEGCDTSPGCLSDGDFCEG